MSASEATIKNFFNLGDALDTGFGVGVNVLARAGRVIGMPRGTRTATSDATQTVHAVVVTTHRWAAKVGKYNDDPIWGEIFANVQESRRQIVEE
jgi:tRNA(Arg) A34 adenosine deaminase TadA